METRPPQKYNQAYTLNFNLYAPDGVDMITGATFAAGDIVIMSDEGAEANTTNLPTDEGTGYSLVLTAAEMSNARNVLYIIDQTGTKVWLDIAIAVETYGNASAQHAFDLDTALQSVNVTQISGDSTAADNLELQYDGTGLTGGSFPATQAQATNITSGSGGLSAVAGSIVITSGTETNVVADTNTLNDTYHGIDDVAGTIDFYYEFPLVSNGVSTGIVWDGYVQGNNDTINVFGYNWVTAQFDPVGTIDGAVGTTRIEESFIFTNAMTGTAANAGLVRLRFESTDASTIQTDRVLCEYTAVAENAFILHKGIAQAGAANTITLDAGASALDDFYNFSRVITTFGTAAEQERVITDYNGTTKVATVTPSWITNPDSTTGFDVTPSQSHAITQGGSYEGSAVYVDEINGNAGTAQYVNGITTNKSSSMADARTIADSLGFNKFIVQNPFTLDQSYIDKIFVVEQNAFCTLNGQEITRTTFMRVAITGVGTSPVVAGIANNPTFELCGIINATLPASNLISCALDGTLTLNEGVYWMPDLTAFEESGAIINVAGDSINARTLNMPNLAGNNYDFQNMTSADSVTISGDCNISLNANCTGGAVNLMGSVSYTDNSGGAVTINILTANQLSEAFTEIKGATWDTTDSLEVIHNNTLSISSQIGVAGAGLTNINLPNQTMDITGNLSGSVGSVNGGATAAAQTAAQNDLDIITGADGVNLLSGTQASIDAIEVDTSTILPALIDDLAIKKNTDYPNFTFLMVLTSDHVTPATGLTVTGQRSIDGGAFEGVSGAIAEVSNGIYQFDALAADTNGDTITWRFSSATADDTFITFKTVA